MKAKIVLALALVMIGCEKPQPAVQNVTKEDVATATKAAKQRRANEASERIQRELDQTNELIRESHEQAEQQAKLAKARATLDRAQQTLKEAEAAYGK